MSSSSKLVALLIISLSEEISKIFVKHGNMCKVNNIKTHLAEIYFIFTSFLLELFENKKISHIKYFCDFLFLLSLLKQLILIKKNIKFINE